MALFSKKVEKADLRRLTVTGSFLSAHDSALVKVRDENGCRWELEYTVKSGSRERFLSGTGWKKFIDTNGVKHGDQIAFVDEESLDNEEVYIIEVIKN